MSWKNDRSAIEAAMDNPDPDDPIAKAIADGVTGFMGRLTAQAEKTGAFPTELLLNKPATEFDDIVIRLTLQTIADETGTGIKIVWTGDGT